MYTKPRHFVKETVDKLTKQDFRRIVQDSGSGHLHKTLKAKEVGRGQGRIDDGALMMSEACASESRSGDR
jgi:hypothetical protein